MSLNKYTNEELSEKHDEMSLVMLINRIQTEEEKQRADEAKQRADAAEKRAADERKQREVLENEVARLRKLLENQEKK